MSFFQNFTDLVNVLLNSPEEETKESRMSRQALQAYIDALAKKDNEIDGCFILNSANQFIMYSEVAGFSGDVKIQAMLGWIGRFTNIGRELSNVGYGRLKYATFPMDDGILTMYFFDREFPQPLTIGFICKQPGDAEKALGEVLYNTKNAVFGYEDYSTGKHIEGIKDMLGKFLK